jgi:hypothetical protein
VAYYANAELPIAAFRRPHGISVEGNIVALYAACGWRDVSGALRLVECAFSMSASIIGGRAAEDGTAEAVLVFT